IGKHARFGIGPVYNMFQLLRNKDRYLQQAIPGDSKLYDKNYFAGAQARFSFGFLNDSIVPTKGIYFITNAQYLNDLQENDRHVMRYDATFHLYIPLSSHFVVAIRSGSATVTGDQEFYHHVSITSSRTLRGYVRDRFWGTSSFYSANELQYLVNLKSKLFN